MYKYLKMVLFVLLVVLSFQQVAFAAEEIKRPPKPTIGIEALDPKHGSSKEVDAQSIQATGDLLSNYFCDIANTGSNLYLDGTTTAWYIVDQVKITLYLQKWDGSQWVDLQSWTFSKYNAKSIIEGTYANYQHGNYYRTRAEHYVKDGSLIETQYSTSSYIYVE